VSKTDLALRSNPPPNRFVLEKLILDLTAEAKPEIPGWSQESCRFRNRTITAREVFPAAGRVPWIVFVLYWIVSAIRTRDTLQTETFASDTPFS